MDQFACVVPRKVEFKFQQSIAFIFALMRIRKVSVSFSPSYGLISRSAWTLASSQTKRKSNMNNKKIKKT